MSIKMISVLAACAVLGASAGAHAAASSKPSSDDNIVRVKISYADLDLGSPAGAKSMLQRIHWAANEACGDRPAGVQLADMRRYQSCMSSAVEGAVASLGAPMVSALNNRGAPFHGVVLANREP